MILIQSTSCFLLPLQIDDRCRLLNQDNSDVRADCLCTYRLFNRNNFGFPWKFHFRKISRKSPSLVFSSKAKVYNNFCYHSDVTRDCLITRKYCFFVSFWISIFNVIGRTFLIIASWHQLTIPATPSRYYLLSITY